MSSSNLPRASVLADAFVPKSIKKDFVLPGLSLASVHLPLDVSTVRHGLVPHPGHPPPVRTLPSDLYTAVVEDIVELPLASVDPETLAPRRWEAILRQEYRERLRLYERLTQYQAILIVSGHECSIEIPGIGDTPVQIGDSVLIRPTIPLPMPSEQTRLWLPVTVDVHCRVKRIRRHKDRHILFSDWLDPTWNETWRRSVLSIKDQSALRYTVRIIPHQETLSRCLTALDWMSRQKSLEWLFPTEAPQVPLVSEMDTEGLNYKQSEFLHMVMGRTLHPELEKVRGPMILTGPAGTGKTRTILQTMKQILKSGGDHRILVCAPSHTAANVITNRLATFLDTKQLLRLVSPDRPIETMSSVIKFCRQDTQTGRFMIPLDLLSFSVIVCTCLDAHLLYLAGLTNEQLRLRREAFAIGLRDSCAKCNLDIPTIEGLDTPHFSHLFIDECAQATEPETWIPLSVVIDSAPSIRKAEVVLVGDPRQLSPEVFSNDAMEAGLGRSLMERLLLRPVSCLGEGHSDLLGPETDLVEMEDWLRYTFRCQGQEQLSIFLTVNYRGHPSFLMLPASLFYSDKLQAAGFEENSSKEESSWCERLRWIESMSSPARGLLPLDNHELSPKKQFDWPIHFRGVVGQDRSVSVKSQFVTNSWSNQEEADVVVEIAESMVQKGVDTQSIGIMAPYRAQVVLLRGMLRAKGLGAIDVGTVEDYQAVERDIVMLSLTRSTFDLTAGDQARRAGLFGQPKRINVALTRAENLLVVVGNPNCMFRDPVWKQFLLFCNRNGLWYGQGCLPETSICSRFDVYRAIDCLSDEDTADSYSTPVAISSMERLLGGRSL